MAALKVSVKIMGAFIENLFVMIIFLYTDMINNYCRYLHSFSAMTFKPFDAKKTEIIIPIWYGEFYQINTKGLPSL